MGGRRRRRVRESRDGREAASEKEGSVAVSRASRTRSDTSRSTAGRRPWRAGRVRPRGVHGAGRRRLADSDLDRSSGPAERSRDDTSRGGGARGDVGGGESFDGDSFDERYRAVSAKHDAVQAQLKARQRELRAAELAALEALADRGDGSSSSGRSAEPCDPGGAPRGFDDAFDDERASKSSAEIPEDIIEAGSATSPGSSLAREAADVDHPGPLAAHGGARRARSRRWWRGRRRGRWRRGA